nr:hypothetical protein [Aetokthonos hydrillicola]
MPQAIDKYRQFTQLTIGNTIMFAQFQSLYPQGSLISELVQIDHGKYIVRASVQIEGVTRATGMAAAETLEDAEDRARTRALMVLGITSTTQEPPASSSKPITQIQPNPRVATTTEFSNSSTYSSNVNSYSQTEPRVFVPSSNVNRQDVEQHFPVINKQQEQLDIRDEDFKSMSFKQPENNPLPEISPSNVTPFTPRSHAPQEEVGTSTTKKSKKSEPVDHSDTIAKIDVEMQRLNWTTEQGRDYLKQAYGKRARSLLNPEELLHFLRYLETQPTPPDPSVGF